MAATFKGEPSITFRRGAKWNLAFSTVDFVADVADEDGARVIVCRVSREALEDRLRQSDESDPLDMFKLLKSDLRALAENKLMAGDLEPDGSVLIRSLDLND